MRVFYLVLACVFILSACKKNEDDDDINPSASEFSDNKVSFAKVYGGSASGDDELFSGIVYDASGNGYFSANVPGDFADRNILIGKINSDGSLAWSKVWKGTYLDKSPDSGQNGESGGTAGSIVLDNSGGLYITGISSSVSQNNNFSVLVLKLNTADGSIAWEKLWREQWPSDANYLAGMSCEAYACDVNGQNVYVTGNTGNNEVFLLVLDRDNGSIVKQYAADLSAGYAERGYAIRVGPSGKVYMSGSYSSNSFLISVADPVAADTAIAEFVRLELGYASAVNSMVMDESENLYLSCDRRGAATYFSVVKMNSGLGLEWGITYTGAGDRNNTHIVALADNYVYAGGRLGIDEYDMEYGDGLILKIDKTTGVLKDAGMYYSGNSGETKAEHRIKGIAVINNSLYIAGQVYTGNYNYDTYDAQWVANPSSAESYSPVVSTQAAPQFHAITTGEVRDASAERVFTDAPSQYVLQSAASKTGTNPPDGDLLFMKLTL